MCTLFESYDRGKAKEGGIKWILFSIVTSAITGVIASRIGSGNVQTVENIGESIEKGQIMI